MKQIKYKYPDLKVINYKRFEFEFVNCVDSYLINALKFDDIYTLFVIELNSL